MHGQGQQCGDCMSEGVRRINGNGKVQLKNPKKIKKLICRAHGTFDEAIWIVCQYSCSSGRMGNRFHFKSQFK